MAIQKATNPDKVLADIRKAIRLQRPVTLDYAVMGENGTLRTVEIYEKAENKNGEIYFKSMDRSTGLPRSWRLDRIQAYAIHRGKFLIERPEAAAQAA